MIRFASVALVAALALIGCGTPSKRVSVNTPLDKKFSTDAPGFEIYAYCAGLALAQGGIRSSDWKPKDISGYVNAFRRLSAGEITGNPVFYDQDVPAVVDHKAEEARQIYLPLVDTFDTNEESSSIVAFDRARCQYMIARSG